MTGFFGLFGDNLEETAPWVAAAVIIAGVIITWMQTRAPLRQADTEEAKVRQEGDASLRADMMRMLGEQNAKLEAAETRNAEQAKACDERIERMESRHSSQLAGVSAEVQSLRHERNNIRQMFDALLLLLKRLDMPEIDKIVADIEAMGARHDQALALERAAIPALKARQV